MNWNIWWLAKRKKTLVSSSNWMLNKFMRKIITYSYMYISFLVWNLNATNLQACLWSILGLRYVLYNHLRIYLSIKWVHGGYPILEDFLIFVQSLSWRQAYPKTYLKSVRCPKLWTNMVNVLWFNRHTGLRRQDRKCRDRESNLDYESYYCVWESIDS